MHKCQLNNLLVSAVCVCVCVCVTFTKQVSSEQILIYNDGPDDAGPIVCRPMELQITAGCDSAWIRTRDCNNTSCTEMQCLRPLRPYVCVTYLTELECLKGRKNVQYRLSAKNVISVHH
jgi:hypothetical protein